MEQNLRTFKDFLQFYNLMSQTCFSHCIDSFKTRELENHEAECVEKCANKLIRFNNRAISVYAGIQTKLMTKRQEELEAQAQQQISAETQSVEEQQQISPEVAESNSEVA